MAPTSAPILFLTNSIYGESTYEETLWRGASRAGEQIEAPFCTVVGGQIVPDSSGTGLKVPFLFQLAARFHAQGAVINAGTLQQRVSNHDLEKFIVEFPQASKVVTAIPMGKVPSVLVDNFAGMKAMIEFLTETMGRKRIAYVSGPMDNTEAQERLRAYREVVAKKGIASDELIVEGTWMGPSGAQAVDRLLERKIAFDAVACANDLMAIGVLERLQARGLSIPSQVAVTGFDDIEAARYVIPQLSTVFQPIEDLGQKAVEVLASRTGKGGDRVTIPARLVVRLSAPAADDHASIEQPLLNVGPDRWLGYLDGLKKKWDHGWMATALDWIRTTWVSGEEPTPASAGLLMKASEVNDQEPLLRLVRSLQASLPQYLDTTDQWRRAGLLIQVLTEAQRDYQFHSDYLAAKKSEGVTASLIGVNRILNQVSRLELLEPALAQALALCGLSTGHVVLVEGHSNLGAKTVASVVGGRGQQAFARSSHHGLEAIIEGGLPTGKNSNWIMLPLTFEDQDLGYIVFGQGPVSAFLYESLANLVSGVLHSVLLIEKIRTAEESAARRGDRIDELVRPMIEALRVTGETAKQQGAVMTTLVQANTDTAQKLVGMDKHVVRMREALGQVVELIGTIEDVSETISVIAINAAIAAARAGSDGKVFGVISSEIRKLAVQTKANTSQITGVLEELESHAETFFEANVQTRTVFSRLEAEIRQLVGSLEKIQGAMESMNGQAQLVLRTMAEN